MKKLVLAIMAAAIFGFCVPASAQMDHFETVGSCMAAPKNTLHYFPTFVHQQRLMENEVIGGLPQLSCVEMQLPDRLVGKEGRGWVRIGDDRKVIFDKNTGKPLRLAECNNTIFEVVPLPEAIPEKGDPGQDGAGCTVKENGDGTKTILCGDRTSAIVRDGKKGDKGDPGVGCTSIDNGDGTKRIVCGDRTSVTVSDGAKGDQGLPGVPAPKSWWENPWIIGGAMVAIAVAGYYICKNNCGGDIINVVAPATKHGVPPGSIINPAF